MKRPALWILIFMICVIYCRLGISLWVCLVCIFLCIVCGSYIVIKTKRKGYLLLLLAFPLGFLLTGYHGADNFVSTAPVSVTGYYVATVSEHGNEDVIANYVKNQGNEYKKLFRNTGIEGQLNIFDYM